MKSRMESKMSSPVVIGVDIGKDVFHLVGFAADGKIAFRRRIRRLGLKDTFEKLPPCIVGMEACLSAHFVSRTLSALGYEPRIVPAIYIKPFVKGLWGARITLSILQRASGTCGSCVSGGDSFGRGHAAEQ